MQQIQERGLQPEYQTWICFLHTCQSNKNNDKKKLQFLRDLFDTNNIQYIWFTNINCPSDLNGNKANSINPISSQVSIYRLYIVYNERFQGRCTSMAFNRRITPAGRIAVVFNLEVAEFFFSVYPTKPVVGIGKWSIVEQSHVSFEDEALVFTNRIEQNRIKMYCHCSE